MRRVRGLETRNNFLRDVPPPPPLLRLREEEEDDEAEAFLRAERARAAAWMRTAAEPQRALGL